MNDLGKLFLRLSMGGLMLPHGFKKLQRVIEGKMEFADPIGIGEEASLILAVLAEFFAVILVIIGFKTRWVAIPVAFTMAVAGFVQHANDPWAKKEFALVYLAGFIAIAILGSGKYSIDERKKW